MKNSVDISRFPKVLLVTSSSFNGITGTGITLSNLFSGWPHQNLAIVHEDSYKNDKTICGNEYKLGPKELIIRFPLSYLLRIKQNTSNYSSQGDSSTSKTSNKYLLKWKIRNLLGGDELFKKKRLSPTLANWIRYFDPALVYCHFSGLNDIFFINQILSIKDVPLVIHTMDDFFQFQYKRGLFAPILRFIWNRETVKILRRASKRICISKKMAQNYEKRYKLPFINFFNAIDMELWINYPFEKLRKNGKFEIRYLGTINSKNINNLIAISEVVKEISEKGQHIKFSIYTFPEHVEIYRKYFINNPYIFLDEVPKGDDIIPLLKNADLLFIPVDFTKRSIESTRYSMFTKIPAYMISGTPILMYGPPGIAAVEYALKGKWAYVVTEKNPNLLRHAILRLKSDKELRNHFSNQAQELALHHHDALKIREQFRQELTTAAFYTK